MNDLNETNPPEPTSPSEVQPPAPESENSPEEEVQEYKWYDYLMNIFVAPGETFQQLGKKAKVLFPISVMFIAMTIYYLSIVPKMMEMLPSVMEKVIDAHNIKIPPDWTEEMMINRMIKGQLISGYIGQFVMVALMLLFAALFIFIYFKFTDREATFKKTFSLVTFAWFPNILHSLFIVILLHATKFKTIHTVGDFQKQSLGFQLLMSSENLETVMQKLLYIFLTLNNPFLVWSLFLLVIGIKYIYKTTYQKAV
ncbi:YIP1 family protein, partial [Candidatus Dependentiae bacterium]|nr:YIP1 family protein [Candidatus Dependentiae bacterium]